MVEVEGREPDALVPSASTMGLLGERRSRRQDMGLVGEVQESSELLGREDPLDAATHARAQANP